MSTNDKIFELYDYIDEHSLDEVDSLRKELFYIDNEWDKLPDEKNEDSDRTLLALEMIDLTLKLEMFELSKKWTQIYLYKEKNQEMIDLYNGQLAFYQKDYQEAYDLFKNAYEISKGRVFVERGEYLDLIKNPEKYIKK